VKVILSDEHFCYPFAGPFYVAGSPANFSDGPLSTRYNLPSKIFLHLSAQHFLTNRAPKTLSEPYFMPSVLIKESIKNRVLKPPA
jgi:hypothetical protein